MIGLGLRVGGGRKSRNALYALDFDGINDYILLPENEGYNGSLIDIEVQGVFIGGSPNYQSIVSKGNLGYSDFIIFKNSTGIQAPVSIYFQNESGSVQLQNKELSSFNTGDGIIRTLRFLIDFDASLFSYYENKLLVYSSPISGSSLNNTSPRPTLMCYSTLEGFIKGKVLSYKINGSEVSDKNNWAGCDVFGATRIVSYDEGSTWQPI